MRQKTHIVFAVCFLSVALVAMMVITHSIEPATMTETDAKEITLQEVPASIQEEMKADMNAGGAYFYRQEDKDTVYALLSAGNLLGRILTVIPTQMEDGVYFSVQYLDTNSREEVLQYRIYETKAAAVAGDDYLLRNPYIKVGAKGLNVGYLKNMTTGYYLLPFMDTDGLNRVYSDSEDLRGISDGLYQISYELTETGAKLLSAAPIDSYSVICSIESFKEGPVSQASVLIGELKANLFVADESVSKKLKTIDFDHNTAKCKVTIGFTNKLLLNNVEVLSYQPRVTSG